VQPSVAVGGFGGSAQAEIPAQSPPEPSALSLLAFGLGVVLRRRRRTV